MTSLIISLIVALISYFTAKKKGASDTAAALAGIGAGAGAYYVTTQTEWGKDVVGSIDKGWTALVGPSGEALKNKDGTPATAPEGAKPQLDASGNVLRDSNGNILWKMLDTAGNVVTTGGRVLTSWGPTGTAAVIGATALATGKKSNWMWWAAGAAVLFIIMKKKN